MKILLIGRTGQLGGSMLSAPRGHEIHAPGRDELDLESRDSCARAIADLRPDVVINTAAFHNVPQCEVEPQRAFAVNCQAVRDLAATCKAMDVRLVTFSSDYVFGGEKRTPYGEDDCPGPVQMYGISRLSGDLAALATAPRHALVVRTCGLYGMSGAASKGGNFVDKRIADARAGGGLQMACDQTVAPTYTRDLAEAVLQLIEHPQATPGIYHLVNEGECTWFEFTRAIYDLMGLEVDLQPVDRGGLSGDMRRPLYSVLANHRGRALGITLPHWRDALGRYLQEKFHR